MQYVKLQISHSVRNWCV